MRDDELLERLSQDAWTDGAAQRLSAAVGSRRAAILSYVERLTRTPAEVRAADVEALRAEGLTDSDVLSVCETAAYYAYANRIADGLGVQLEPHMESDAD